MISGALSILNDVCIITLQFNFTLLQHITFTLQQHNITVEVYFIESYMFKTMNTSA